MLILDQYLNHEDFQFLITVLPTITKEENKITSIKNVVGYVTGLAISIKDGDLSAGMYWVMRDTWNLLLPVPKR